MNGVGFGAPWILLAALAAAAPIVAHLARHEDREGRGFPSLMFLRRVPFATRARRKLADRALLALRVLAVLALVLSFAQPYLLFDGARPGSPQRARVVLLDRSYSMGIGDRFERARRAAQEALRVSDDSTRVALVVFDARASTLSGFDAGSSGALEALRSVQAGNRATDLSKALAHASRILASSSLATRELILISDLQLSGIGADPELASDIALQVLRIDDRVAGNLALLGAWHDEREGPKDAALSLHARIANTGSEALSASLRVDVDGLRAAQQRVSLAAGAVRELVLPVYAARERPTRVQLFVDDDPIAIDNVRYLVIAPARPVNVLWVGDSSRGNVYVNAAVSPSAAPRGSRLRVRNVDVTKLESSQLDGADVIVLDGVHRAASQFAAAIQRRVAQGAGLLSVMGAATPPFGQTSAPVDGPLAAVVAGIQGAPRRTPGATTLAALTPDHALSVALGDARLSGIPVWRYQLLEPRHDDHVLARFADGAPALLERDHGLGRSLTLALSLHPQASDLVLDPVFVPLLVESLVHLSQRSVTRVQYEAGDVVDAARYADAVVGGDAVARALHARRAVQLRTPTGGTQEVAVDTLPVLGETGFYELRVADAPPLPIAVNAAAAEWLLEAMTEAQLRARIHRGATLANTTSLGDGVEQRDPRIARWLLWLALAALLAEALFGAWLARRRVPQQVGQQGAQQVAR